MKIPQRLPQFDKKTGLFVVVGYQDGVIYSAKKGSITIVKRITMPIPRYSDREGFFKAGSKRNSMTAGSVREKTAVKFGVRKRFLETLAKELSQITRRESSVDVYLFAPRHLLRPTSDALPKTIQKHMVGMIGGDMRDAHPLALLEKITQPRFGKQE